MAAGADETEAKPAARKPRVRKARAEGAPGRTSTTAKTADDAAGAAPAGAPDRPLEAEAVAHAPCLNCGTPLVGHYCHECGQQAHLHNKLKHLLHEFVEGIAHFDGRLWRTLPILALNPGRLSRAWIEGRRARYVAPLHVFLFAVFIMFTVPSFLPRGADERPTINFNGVEAPKDPEARKAFFEAQRKAMEMQVDPEAKGFDAFVQNGVRSIMRFFGPKMDKQQYYSYKFKTLLYKLSFLFAPISMAILWLLLLYKRRFSLYDHGVVALYGLGFMAMLITIAEILPGPLAGLWTVFLFAFVPIHAIRHLRQAYLMSWPGALVVGALMGVLTLVALLLFVGAVLFLGFTG
ncbi:MAG TPA: DUF3667 domain-containing protein [Caulobacter sp.]|nr:DUF3667 domain-containing protein [Caulobacter sp.]